MSANNIDRIRAELFKATTTLPERFPGYRESLIEVALECMADAAEHDDRRTNINRRFDARIENIAGRISANDEEDE